MINIDKRNTGDQKSLSKSNFIPKTTSQEKSNVGFKIIE